MLKITVLSNVKFKLLAMYFICICGENFKSTYINKYLAEHQFYLIRKHLIAHGGWIGSSFASVLSLGTTARMIHHLLH